MRITAIRTIPGEITLPRPATGGLGPIHKLGLVATMVQTDAGLEGEHLLITLHGRHVRVLAGLENATWLEHMPWLSPLYHETIEVQDGAAVVPDRPGWGFTLDHQRITRAAG